MMLSLARSRELGRSLMCRVYRACGDRPAMKQLMLFVVAIAILLMGVLSPLA